MSWIRAGHVVLKASNGRYVTAAATGHMKASSESAGDLEVFRIALVNRPILVLKCDFGLVGYKNKTGYKLECNKATFNVVLLEESPDHAGYYYFKGSHCLYWDIGADFGVTATSQQPAAFSIELVPNNRMVIKGPNGCYLKGEQSGSLTCSAQDSRSATQWEF
jgi:hypothetical protein